MEKKRYIKPEPPEVKGICTKCGEREQALVAKGKYRALCGYCHRNRYDYNSWGYKKYRAYKGDLCEDCGFVPKDPCQLDVHHIDGNHSNNDPLNLKTLCANCHRLHHR